MIVRFIFICFWKNTVTKMVLPKFRVSLQMSDISELSCDHVAVEFRFG